MSGNNLYNLGLIGCGHMGSAMLRGWQDAKTTKHIYIFDPAAKTFDNKAITKTEDLNDFLPTLPDLDCLVLAVKPQILGEVSMQIAPNLPANLPVLSIAAGYSVSSFHKYFPDTQPIIRCMPNTPGAIGKGITGVLKTGALTPAHQSMATSVLSALGDVVWLDDENLMDAVTAVSGSGPAYLFYMIEALTKAGIDAGLPQDTAEQLARQTIIGAAALAENTPNTPASILRENVTSPGGTTQAALEVLMNGDFQNTITKAVQAAFKRGQDLST